MTTFDEPNLLELDSSLDLVCAHVVWTSTMSQRQTSFTAAAALTVYLTVQLLNANELSTASDVCSLTLIICVLLLLLLLLACASVCCSC
jgi:hypothetical protein